MIPSEPVSKITYRLIFYLSGLFFAITTYVTGTWVYKLETAAVDHSQRTVNFVKNAEAIFAEHPFTFISWVVAVAFLSIVIGWLFDKEVADRRKAEQKANIDGLTEVYNHRYFQERLASEIERANRYCRPLSVAMFDLDDFKQFNDRHGHQEGDQLLKWFVRLCDRNIRSMDVLARYGGEEFVLILPETGSEKALIAVERIRTAMEAEGPQSFPNHSTITVSVGVASLPEHSNSRHGLVLAADTALYYAKRQGKNCSYVYCDDHRKVYRTTPERLKAMLDNEDVEVIEALSAAVDAKDNYTNGHSNTVSRLCLSLAEKMGVPECERESLRVAALLHDIGKIGTPDAILKKPGKLEDQEREIVEHHPGVGSHILQKVQQLTAIVPSVKHHHERYDGKGYPNGLVGKNIPLFARMIALADAFDAMTSNRPYRPALSTKEAIEEIRRCSGTQFDPELVEAFIHILQSQEIADSDERPAA